MIFGFGVVTVLAGYVSVRAFEYYRQNSSRKPLKVFKLQKSNSITEKLNALIESDENKKNKHYVTVSGLTIGLAIARGAYPILLVPTILLFTYTAIPYLRQVEKSIVKDKKIDGYVLYSIADIMMLGLKAYTSAAIGVALLHLSKYILSNAKENTKRQMVDIFNHQPDRVWVLKDGVEVQVPIDQVKKGDDLIISAGDIIPVDGTVTDGIAAIDQKLLTGESQPSDKTIGDKVFASTMVISGRISVNMEQSGQDTIVAKIGDIINHSIEFKGDQALKGERWADSFTLPVMSLAFLSWPFLGAVGTVGILYCHIANTIRVVAPLGTLNYLNIAVKNGILIKDGHALEELINIDTIVFDKTGTLTQEIPEVGQIILCTDEYNESDILYYAASAEQKSVHPIARAIQKKAEEQNIQLPEIDDSSYEIGYGISVEIEGKTVSIGSSRFMQLKEIAISETEQEQIDHALETGHSVIMLAINSTLCGILEIHTIVRPEAKRTIRALRNSGIKHMVVVSGDHKSPTKTLADALGIDEYYSDVLPDEKAQIVEKLQQSGKKVAVIGDGVNDTIAMEKADISISLNGASTIATDVAKIVLMDADLTHIPYVIELSKKLDKNLSRSLILNLIPNIIALNGVLFFRFGMLTSMLVSQSPLVLGSINALLPIKPAPVHTDDDAPQQDSSKK